MNYDMNIECKDCHAIWPDYDSYRMHNCRLVPHVCQHSGVTVDEVKAMVEGREKIQDPTETGIERDELYMAGFKAGYAKGRQESSPHLDLSYKAGFREGYAKGVRDGI